MQTQHTNSVSSFQDFGFDPKILNMIHQQGYTQPTQIQAQAIPLILKGRDIIGIAQTGTGKTASFALPILQKLLPFANTSPSPAKHFTRALILAPTRELAHQVAENIKILATGSHLQIAVLFGGVEIEQQMKILQAGVEIIIATPGRLLDHLQQKNVRLSQVNMLVLDEADRMLDMGFLPDLLRIVDYLPQNRQTLLFSATFSKEIKTLATRFLSNPEMVEVAQNNSTSIHVSQTVYSVSLAQKQKVLLELLRTRELKQVIVFLNSRLGVSRLANYLQRHQLSVADIHGNKTQHERMRVLESFKRGEIDILVATDVAARGLDVVGLPAVINYDLPFNPEDYVHRIGRTGRAGLKGLAISFCSADEERLLKDIQKLTQHSLMLEPYYSNQVKALPRNTQELSFSKIPYSADKALVQISKQNNLSKKEAVRVPILLGGSGRY